jgi:alpha-glucosidase
LPQPSRWAELTVETQQRDPHSMLSLYRTMLRIRRSDPDIGDGPLRWLPSTDTVLAFAMGDKFICVTNFSPGPIELPADCSLLLASAELVGGLLPSDSTAWLRPERAQLRILLGPTEGGE